MTVLLDNGNNLGRIRIIGESLQYMHAYTLVHNQKNKFKDLDLRSFRILRIIRDLNVNFRQRFSLQTL